MKNIFTWRVWILLLFIVLAIIAINPTPIAEGIEVKSVPSGSEISEQGLSQGEILLTINENAINTIDDYNDAIAELQYESQEIEIKTTEETLTYTITNDIQFLIDVNLTIYNSELLEDSTLLEVNGQEIDTYEEFDAVLDVIIPKQKLIIRTDEGEYAYLSREVPDLTIGEAAKSNLLMGLDLQGGTRVLLQPIAEDEVSDADITDLISVLENRLNVYGLSDIKIRRRQG